MQKCSGHGADQVFEASISTLEKHLTKEKTHPELQEAILQCLKKWRRGQRILPFEFSYPVRLAVREQNKIGWLDLLEGRATKQWQIIQKQYYEDNNMRKSSRRWIRCLLVQLHHLAWKQWNHRNQINQRVTKPALAEMVHKLDAEITTILSTQMHEMFSGDRTRLRMNLLTLTNKPIRYKKSWLANACAARQRFLRHRTRQADLKAHSKQASKLFQYFKQFPK